LPGGSLVRVDCQFPPKAFGVKHEARRRSRAIPVEGAGKNAPLCLVQLSPLLSEQRDARVNNTIKKSRLGRAS